MKENHFLVLLMTIPLVTVIFLLWANIIVEFIK